MAWLWLPFITVEIPLTFVIMRDLMCSSSLEHPASPAVPVLDGQSFSNYNQYAITGVRMLTFEVRCFAPLNNEIIPPARLGCET